jgi:glycosyltransferase involved in cell wall biosynthesis
VTPARDEEQNLARLAESMISQRVPPAAWVIVENGSTDATLALARRLAAEYSWIAVREARAGNRYDRTSPYIGAFHAGVEALGDAGDLVVKLDADVSMDDVYWEEVLRAFESDPKLGIASGTLMEKRDGTWREISLLDGHCWGPTRTYRRACLRHVLPLDPGYGYAIIDEARARLAGFRVATLRELPFRHHRPEGAGEGSAWRNWREQGVAAHHLGYRPSYVLARCAYRLPTDRAALALLAGYAGCSVRRSSRYQDEAVVRAVRERQRARNFFVSLRRPAPSRTAS